MCSCTSSPSLQAIITESEPIGSELFTVNATDGDQLGTANVELTFDLRNPPLPFYIDPFSGVVSVNDTLTAQTYEIVVGVSDRGSPVLTSTATFSVEVAPANLYSPEFISPFEIEFLENLVTSPPVVVFNFAVEDADPGLEGTVNLTLLESEFSANFSLEFSNDVNGTALGRLYLLDPFDRESITNFTLEVGATDIGHELFRRNNSQAFSVLIQDDNDEYPEFVGAPYATRVPENATGGLSFFQVEATDDDIGINAELSFSLAEGSDFNNTFAINRTSGSVTVIGTLLRAEQSFYELTIIVTDLDGAPDGLNASTTLNVTVSEVNDNQPEFSPNTPPNITIPEDTAQGYILVNLTVSDADTGPSGEIELFLEQIGSVFDLDGDSLILNTTVDFEVSSLFDISACESCVFVLRWPIMIAFRFPLLHTDHTPGGAGSDSGCQGQWSPPSLLLCHHHPRSH